MPFIAFEAGQLTEEVKKQLIQRLTEVSVEVTGIPNMLSLPARFIDLETAKEIAQAFIETRFEGGRHQRRVDKIPCR